MFTYLYCTFLVLKLTVSPRYFQSGYFINPMLAITFHYGKVGVCTYATLLTAIQQEVKTANILQHIPAPDSAPVADLVPDCPFAVQPSTTICGAKRNRLRRWRAKKEGRKEGVTQSHPTSKEALRNLLCVVTLPGR